MNSTQIVLMLWLDSLPTPQLLVVDALHFVRGFVLREYYHMPHLPFWASDDAGPQTEAETTPRKVFGSLDVHEYLVRHPAATYFLRMEGNELENEGVRDGDVLVIDRSRQPKRHDLIIAVYDGEMYARKIVSVGGEPVLRIDGKNVALAGVDIWGTVCGVVRRL